MATDKSFVDFVCEQLREANAAAEVDLNELPMPKVKKAKKD
jgi:hypothetical protein